jgi:type II secretory pathway component PulL
MFFRLHRLRLACLIAAAWLVLWSSASAQGFKWWQNDRYRTEFTAEQSRRLEEIFQSTLPHAHAEEGVRRR